MSCCLATQTTARPGGLHRSRRTDEPGTPRSDDGAARAPCAGAQRFHSDRMSIRHEEPPPAPDAEASEHLALLRGARSPQKSAATLLLAQFREGYWLNRLTRDPALNAVRRDGEASSVDWDRVLELLRSPGRLDDAALNPQTAGACLAVLEIAASLAAGHPLDLGEAARRLPRREWSRILSSIRRIAQA